MNGSKGQIQCAPWSLEHQDSFSWQKLPVLTHNRSSGRTRIERILGDGPMRFAPKRKERTIAEQFERLSRSEKEALFAMKEKFRKKALKKKYSDALFPSDAHTLRCARASRFQLKKAWKVLRNYIREDVRRLLTLKASEIEEQLRSKTLFPLPGLQCRNGNNVFYMKPSRFSPNETPTQLVIDNLAYVMNCMLEEERSSKSGIAFLANMDDWTFENFSPDYCRRFMEILQGSYFPVNVTLFLIVNPPSWFDRVWKIMRPMLSKEFRKKVHVIPESDLFEYLPFHYEAFLPDEMESGMVPTDSIVNDFVTYRLFVEQEAKTMGSDTQLTNSGSCRMNMRQDASDEGSVSPDGKVFNAKMNKQRKWFR